MNQTETEGGNVPPTFEQALIWTTHWMEARHPTFTPESLLGDTYWGDDFVEYVLCDNEMTGPYLKATSIEIAEIPIFRFIIPKTKDDFFTLLNILDK